MRSEDEVVETLRRAYRDASERLDDAPDARVRAAVLAAAARGVDARPRLATIASTAAPNAWPSRARHWPWSAAALLVVSVTTGVVATHVMRDSPERVTTIASSVPVMPASKPEARTPESPAREPSNATAAAGASAPAAARLPVTAPSSPKRPVPRNESQQANVDRAEKQAALASGSRSARGEPPPPTAPPAQQVAAQADARSDPQSRDAEAGTPSNTERAAAPAALTAMRAHVGRSAEPVTPEGWVERIVQLRAAGNDAEADRELDGLRRRYPGFAIPANALPPSGTR